MKMKNTRNVVFLFLLFVMQKLAAQIILTRETNSPVVGDRIVRHTVSGLCCESKGENCVWDFSDNVVQEKVSPIHFSKDTSGFKSLEPGNCRYYKDIGDSIWIYGYRSKLETMSYSSPQLFMTYSLCYGDSIFTTFSGEGKFCEDYTLSHNGSKIIMADAWGSILLPGGRALPNVLRVHTIVFKNVLLEGLAPNLSDTAKAKQEMEESFLWFVEGCRYPVFANHIGTSFSDGVQVASHTESYCYLPDSVLASSVPYSDILCKSDEGRYNGAAEIQSFPIDYVMSQTGNTIRVSLVASSGCSVTFIVASTTGMLYQNRTVCCGQGENKELSFCCDGYKTGGYILYVSINGVVKSEKFYVK